MGEEDIRGGGDERVLAGRERMGGRRISKLAGVWRGHEYWGGGGREEGT